MISASTREILAKEVNEDGGESNVCFHYYMLFHWDCVEGETEELNMKTSNKR